MLCLSKLVIIIDALYFGGRTYFLSRLVYITGTAFSIAPSLFPARPSTASLRHPQSTEGAIIEI